MSMTTAQEEDGCMSDGTKPEPLEWRVHPLLDCPVKKSIALVIVLTVVLSAVRLAFHELGYLLVAAAFLLIAMAKYLFPTHYKFTHDGILIQHLGLKQQRDWVYFKSFFISRTGVFLSPFESRSMLENFRGQFILFGQDDREEVISFVRNYIKKEQ